MRYIFSFGMTIDKCNLYGRDTKRSGRENTIVKLRILSFFQTADFAFLRAGSGLWDFLRNRTNRFVCAYTGIERSLTMFWNFGRRSQEFAELIYDQKPAASAEIRGSKSNSGLHGSVLFYQTKGGVLVTAEIFGLPQGEGNCGQRVFGFHIHEYGSCTGNSSDPFADTGMHYNPNQCPHPAHAGDLPPLFGNKGYAWSSFVTDRFQVEDIIGRSVIVHDSPDDFVTQPSGNSGKKIGCGVIKKRR